MRKFAQLLFVGVAASAMLAMGPATDVAPTGPIVVDVGPTPLPQPTPFPTNFFVKEPLLIYDTTGGTLIGLFHTNLVVYNNGDVSLAERSDTVIFPFPELSGHGFQSHESVRTAHASNEQLRALYRALHDAGAATLPDHVQFVSDVPLTTVTFFHRPRPQSRANTFSYFLGGGPYGDVNQAVQRFVDDVFGR